MLALFTFTPLLTVTYDTGGVTTLLEKKCNPFSNRADSLTAYHSSACSGRITDGAQPRMHMQFCSPHMQLLANLLSAIVSAFYHHLH